MKKIKNIYKSFIYIAIAVGTLGFSSCEQLDNEFEDPDKRQGQLPPFFTKALEQSQLFRLDYGQSYHQINGMCVLTGLAAHSAYSYSSRGNTNAIPTWTMWSVDEISKNIFRMTNVNYTVNVNGMQLLYNAMSAQEQERYKPYMMCAKIARYYGFQRSTDMYGDIPYTEAGGAFQEKFFPKYDTQESIYKSILADLKIVSDELSTYKFELPQDKDEFSAADILNNGDLDKWIRFANSLRLRMAMRIVNVEPALSKSIIEEIVRENKLITEVSQDVSFKELTTDVNKIKLDLFFRAFNEMAYRAIGPKFIMQDLLHSDAVNKYDTDPRLYVLFQPNRYGKYVGNSAQHDDLEYLRKYFPKSEFDDNRFKQIVDSIAFNYSLSAAGDGWAEIRLVSQYNRATFMNYEMKFPVMLSSEVNLLLAEANVRWPGIVPTDAASLVKKSIENSTRYYYALNMTNKYDATTSPDLRFVWPGARMSSLDEAHLSSYLTKAGNEFNGLDKLGKIRYIFNQKVISYNIIYPYEIYSEARRLIGELGGIPLQEQTNLYWQERLLYPDTEAILNKDNFAVVADKNYINVPVWWTGRTKAAVNPNASPGVDLNYK